jgi:cytochrome bd-type quinol oxidase subunit 1
MPGIIIPFMLFTVLYGVLALVVVWSIWRHIAATERHMDDFDDHQSLSKTEQAGTS